LVFGIVDRVKRVFRMRRGFDLVVFEGLWS
jgi:hypothetical protein